MSRFILLMSIILSLGLQARDLKSFEIALDVITLSSFKEQNCQGIKNVECLNKIMQERPKMLVIDEDIELEYTWFIKSEHIDGNDGRGFSLVSFNKSMIYGNLPKRVVVWFGYYGNPLNSVNIRGLRFKNTGRNGEAVRLHMHQSTFSHNEIDSPLGNGIRIARSADRPNLDNLIENNTFNSCGSNCIILGITDTIIYGNIFKDFRRGITLRHPADGAQIAKNYFYQNDDAYSIIGSRTTSMVNIAENTFIRTGRVGAPRPAIHIKDVHRTTNMPPAWSLYGNDFSKFHKYPVRILLEAKDQLSQYNFSFNKYMADAYCVESVKSWRSRSYVWDNRRYDCTNFQSRIDASHLISSHEEELSKSDNYSNSFHHTCESVDAIKKHRLSLISSYYHGSDEFYKISQYLKSNDCVFIDRPIKNYDVSRLITLGLEHGSGNKMIWSSNRNRNRILSNAKVLDASSFMGELILKDLYLEGFRMSETSDPFVSASNIKMYNSKFKVAKPFDHCLVVGNKAEIAFNVFYECNSSIATLKNSESSIVANWFSSLPPNTVNEVRNPVADRMILHEGKSAYIYLNHFFHNTKEAFISAKEGATFDVVANYFEANYDKAYVSVDSVDNVKILGNVSWPVPREKCQSINSGCSFYEAANTTEFSLAGNSHMIRTTEQADYFYNMFLDQGNNISTMIEANTYQSSHKIDGANVSVIEHAF